MNADNPYLKDELKDRAVLFKPGEGQILTSKGGTITMKVTSEMSGDQLGVYSICLKPKTVGAQLHYHRFMDETFIVNRGTLTVQHGEAKAEMAAGSVIYVPRFTPHGFANDSDEQVEVTLIFNPAQKREGFFLGLTRILNTQPVRSEEFIALYNKYDSYPVGEINVLSDHAGK